MSTKHSELVCYLVGQLPEGKEGNNLLSSACCIPYCYAQGKQYGIESLYLVGVMISANTPYGSLESCWRMGRANAAVFPLPVFAHPIQSLPMIIYKINTDAASIKLFIFSPSRIGGMQLI